MNQLLRHSSVAASLPFKGLSRVIGGKRLIAGASPKTPQSETFVATFVAAFVEIAHFSDKGCDEGCDKGSESEPSGQALATAGRFVGRRWGKGNRRAASHCQSVRPQLNSASAPKIEINSTRAS
jgi:hypothetical protein